MFVGRTAARLIATSLRSYQSLIDSAVPQQAATDTHSLRGLQHHGRTLLAHIGLHSNPGHMHSHPASWAEVLLKHKLARPEQLLILELAHTPGEHGQMPSSTSGPAPDTGESSQPAHSLDNPERHFCFSLELDTRSYVETENGNFKCNTSLTST